MGALVLWKPERGELVPAEGQRCASFDLTTPEGQRLGYQCHVSCDYTLKQLVGEEIAIVDFYAHLVARADEKTGEIGPGVRAVFILEDGTKVATSSASALKGVQSWSAMTCRVPPWNPPLRFLVRQSPSRTGPGDYLWMDLPPAKTDNGKGA